MRRDQPLPHGLRDFLADLHCAGAAVDFSVLYPSGQLVDAPLPTWTHRQLLVGSDGQGAPAEVRTPSRSIRCWARTCGCRRSRSATRGRATSAPRRCRGWPTTRSHAVPAFPGAAYCEMALAAARTLFGETIRGARHPL